MSGCSLRGLLVSLLAAGVSLPAGSRGEDTPRVQSRRFRVDASLQDQQIISNTVLFTGSAPSKGRCASQCAYDWHCMTFTFVRPSQNSLGSCQGHTTESPGSGTYATEPLSGAKTYKLDPCVHYLTWDDARRNLYYGHSNICDKVEAPGWFRFKHNGANAKLAPASSIGYYKCGTDIPLHLKLQGASLPTQAGQELETRVVGPDGAWGRKVTVRRCAGAGAFYVYRLGRATSCNIGFCTLPE